MRNYTALHVYVYTCSFLSLQCQAELLQVTMSADTSAATYPRTSWSADRSSRGRLTPGNSPYRNIMDPRRLLPYSPLSSGQSSPDGNRGSREFSRFRTRSRSLSPQGRNLISPYGIGHIQLHMSHTMVDSEISSIASCGSRKSSVDTENYMMTLDSLQRRGHAGLNGWNGGFVAGDWKDERDGLLMEILECQRRIQVFVCILLNVVSSSLSLSPLFLSFPPFLPLISQRSNLICCYKIVSSLQYFSGQIFAVPNVLSLSSR